MKSYTKYGGLLIILVFAGFLLFKIFSAQDHSTKNSVNVINKSEKEPGIRSIDRVDNYQGQLIAGSTSLFLAFNQSDYDKALGEGKTIFLDFYANWCPVCRGEEKDIEGGFDSLTNSNLVGFRVNYNDSETDENENKLADEFNVPNQYTKIIIKKGEEIYRSRGETWDEETVRLQLSEI